MNFDMYTHSGNHYPDLIFNMMKFLRFWSSSKGLCYVELLKLSYFTWVFLIPLVPKKSFSLENSEIICPELTGYFTCIISSCSLFSVLLSLLLIRRHNNEYKQKNLNVIEWTCRFWTKLLEQILKMYMQVINHRHI